MHIREYKPEEELVSSDLMKVTTRQSLKKVQLKALKKLDKSK